MNNSVSLNSGSRFNKKIQRLQEGMQVMDTPVDTINYTSIDAVSKNKTSTKTIEEENKDSIDKITSLITEFDNVKNKLLQRLNNYITSRTQLGGDNIINKGGINILVTEPSTVDMNSLKFEGCYTDKDDRAIKNLQNEGYIFNVDACAQRAVDLGQTVFGVQNVNTDGLAKCFIGSDLESAKKYGYAYKTEQTWQTNTANKNVKTLLLNLNGNLTLHDDTFITPDKTKDVYIGNSYQDNVKKIELDRIGMIIGNKPTNTQSPNWKDTFSVTNDGKTISVRRTDSTTGWGQNLHLEGTYNDVTNIVWTSETIDRNDTYNCPSYFKQTDDFTSNEAKYCSGYRLVMQDDGNLVIINQNRTTIWSTNTNKPGAIRVDEWLSGTYRGRDYLNAGESLTVGQWISSKNGANIAKLERSGNFCVYRSIYPCKSVNGQIYGAGYSNAVYSLPKSTIDNLGSMAYFDTDANTTYSYPNFLDNYYDLQDNTFILIGTYNSYDQDLSSFSASTIEECEAAAAKVPECGGFIYNKKQQRCFLKGKNMWPKSQRVLDNDCIMKIKAPKVDVNSSCSTEFLTTSSSNFELYPKTSGSMNKQFKCGLTRLVDENKPEYDEENELLMKNLEIIQGKINILSQEQKLNLEELPNLRTKLRSRFEDYKRIKRDYDTYHNRKMDPTMTQYKRDSELKRNMYHLDSSTMALLGVGGLLLAMQLMK